ncbi:MAG: CHAT domain-containing tetratricopeptide repeat protein [Bacteroidia bacterium]|nr:CHAT domain-containing tetratricopeptide repeat protein [Bacteroidia bacterium]
MKCFRSTGFLLLFIGLFFLASAQKSDTTGVWARVILAEKKLDSLQYDPALALLDEAENLYLTSRDHEKLTAVWLKKTFVYLSLLDFSLTADFLIKTQKAIDPQNPQHAQNRADWLFLKGVFFHETAAYDSALVYLQQCEPLYRKIYGPQSRHTGQCLYFFSAAWLRKADYKASLGYSEQALRIFAEADPDSAWLGKTYNLIGFNYGEQGYLNKQIEFYQKSLAVNLLLYGDDHYEVAVNYNNLAYTEGIKGNFYQAIFFLEKCLKINEKNPRDNQQLLGSNYLNLGMNYAYVGDYGRADYYMAKALEVRTRIYGENHPDIANVHHNMGSVALDLGEYEKAQKHFTQTLEIRTRYLGESNPYVALSHTMLGRSLLNLKQTKTALIHLRRGLSGLQKVLGDGHIMVANSYFDLGLCLEEMGQRDEALKNYEKAIEIIKNIAGHDNALLTRLYDAYAYALESSGKTEKSLAVLQEGLIVISEGFSDRNFRKNPSLSQLNLDITGVFLLGQKAETVRKTPFGQTEAGLQFVWQAYLLTDSLIQKLRLGFFNEKSGEMFSRRFLSVYENAIGLASQIFEQTGDSSFLYQAFSLAEKAKSMLLFQAIRENQALITAGIPPDLLNRERYLRAEVSYFEKVIFDEKHKGIHADSVRLLDIVSRHFALTRERDSLIQQFEKKFPEYYHLKFDNHTATVAEVQKQLDEGESMLSYFTGEKHIYSFLITKDEFAFHSQATDTAWHTGMTRFISYLKNTELADQKAYTTQSYLDFVSPARRFYRDLVAPFEEKLRQRGDLIIIPDGVMGYLPFEVLLTAEAGEEVNYTHLPYLLRLWQVRYAYSATLFCTPRVSSRKKQAIFAGFAPGMADGAFTTSSSDNRRSTPRFPKIYANQPEVQTVAGLMKGKSWLAAQATETAFRENAEEYKILHLATHAWINDENPLYSGLWFVPEIEGDTAKRDSLSLIEEVKDGFLHAYEIYNLVISADLAVLSACETGSGVLRRGEGIMSLARAFRYAGCPSVLMTLWKAEDVATRDLMAKFYQNLHSGMEKDKALQKAKLDFLTDSDRQHPHFWADFILIGDESPVKDGQPWGIWILIFVIAGGVLAGVLWKKYRSSYI